MSAENEYGEMIQYERSHTDISVDKLCEGLCSRAYLQRIENGKRTCEKLLADALLQRLGVSADKFSYVINVREQDILLLKEQLVEAINENKQSEAKEYLTEYKERIKGKSALYQQFCMLAESVLAWKTGKAAKELLKEVSEAWKLTKEGKSMQKLEGQYLSYYEISLSMLYSRLLADSGAVAEALSGYRELLFYFEKHLDVTDRVKCYPQVAYQAIVLFQKQGQRKEAIELCEKAIGLLRSQAALFYLAELLGEYEELLAEGIETEAEDIQKERKERIAGARFIRKALEWLYECYEIPPDEWIWDISFGMSEIYLCQDIIRGRRIGLGMSQEELAEGICDPVTVSRIECGKNYPKRTVLLKLLQKVKWSGENQTLTAQVGRPEQHRITSEISRLMHLGENEAARELLEELDQKIKQKNIYAKQYFFSTYAAIKFNLKEMDAREHYQSEQEILHLTIPENIRKEELKKWHFSRKEVMSINNMSHSCEAAGQDRYVLELLYIVRRFYERQIFQMRYFRAGYELTLRNIGNLLGNMKEYESAIETSDSCIKFALGLRKAKNPGLALYDRGWDMEQLWEEGKYTKEESYRYVKAAYALNLFLDRKMPCRFIEKHVKDKYGEEIETHRID